jgi:hypothetical protein
VTEEEQSVPLRLTIFVVQAFVAAACTLFILLFAAMYVAAMVRDPALEAQSACTEENPDYPRCWPPVSSYSQEENPPISEARRGQLRTALLRAFPDAESNVLIAPPTIAVPNPEEGTNLRQAQSFSCNKNGPAALLQERATNTYEKVKRNCLVPVDTSAGILRADRLDYFAYGCGAPDWCPDNGRLQPVGVKLPPLDHPRTHCTGRPYADLREIMSQKTCDNASLIKWSKEGDRMAKFVFWTRANDNPNYKKDPSVASISHEQALAWLVQAALPAEILDPLRASCSNTGSGVRDAACDNFGNPEAQIELAAVIARSTPRTKGWEALSRELVYFASANGQPDAADQVGQLHVEKQP